MSMTVQIFPYAVEMSKRRTANDRWLPCVRLSAHEEKDPNFLGMDIYLTPEQAERLIGLLQAELQDLEVTSENRN